MLQEAWKRSGCMECSGRCSCRNWWEQSFHKLLRLRAARCAEGALHTCHLGARQNTPVTFEEAEPLSILPCDL